MTSTHDTGPLTVTTSFWVRVTNTRGSDDSATAVKTVVQALALEIDIRGNGVVQITPVEAIFQANPNLDPRRLQIGQRIRIPE